MQVVVRSCIDYDARVHFRKDDIISEDFNNVFIHSVPFAQVVLPVGVFFGGIYYRDSEVSSAGAAAMQALAINASATTVLKVATGRRAPFSTDDPHDWKPFSPIANGFKDPRIFWPSGHTSSTVVLVSAFYGFYPKKHWIAIFGYPFSAAVGIAMMDRNFHWASDVVAGFLIGHAIGYTVGRNFRLEYDRQRARSRNHRKGERTRFAMRWRFAPLVSSEYVGGVATAGF